MSAPAFARSVGMDASEFASRSRDTHVHPPFPVIDLICDSGHYLGSRRLAGMQNNGSTRSLWTSSSCARAILRWGSEKRGVGIGVVVVPPFVVEIGLV